MCLNNQNTKSLKKFKRRKWRHQDEILEKIFIPKGGYPDEKKKQKMCC